MTESRDPPAENSDPVAPPENAADESETKSVDSPSVFLISGDLLFASKVRVAVQSMGGTLRVAGKLPDGNLADWTHLIVDLATRFKMVQPAADRRRDDAPATRLLAFGPHVQVDRLQAARDNGFDLVLTNRQFSGDVVGWLVQR